MSHLIVPIDLHPGDASSPRCCNLTDKRTSAYLRFSAVETSTDHWTLVDADGTEGSAVKGEVIFGVCCATSINLTVAASAMSDYDIFDLQINGTTVDPEATGVTYDHALHPGDTTYSRTFDLDFADYNGGQADRPCGHIVSIYVSTVLAPDKASLWTAVLNSIT